MIDKIRKLTGIKKVGHAGTLDPLAKGILVIGIGRPATKKLHQIVIQKKEYLASIKLGYNSTTDDADGKIEKIKNNKKPTSDEIKKTLASFKGQIWQIPPIFSALKIKGAPAYKLARRGQKPKLKKRLVQIDKIVCLDYHWPIVKIKVACGSGVYIRALARDLGKKLQTGAYLNNLERTKIGNFDKKNCLSLKQIKTKFQSSVKSKTK